MSARKRVIFCTYPSIYSTKALTAILQDSDIEIVAIVESTRVLKPSLNPVLGSLYQLKTSGLRYSAYLFLVTGFYQWLECFRRYQKTSAVSTDSLVRKQQIPVMKTRDINTPDMVQAIRNLQADYLVCAHFNQLIKQDILSLPSMQCINIHPSLLPDYKGVDPVFYAMQDEQNQFGVTLHRMDKDFDSGETLAQTAMPLSVEQSLLHNNCLLFSEGGRLVVNWIKHHQASTSANRPSSYQTPRKDTSRYDSWPTRHAVKLFKRSGKRLLTLAELWRKA